VTSPLPAIKDDPAIAAGLAAKRAFEAKAAEVRANWEGSDALIAQRVSTLWRETTAELKRLADDFNARRQARWDALQALIPTGPHIADDASEVDKAALHAAFRAAVTAAREADAAGRQRMYTDARRFGDELTQRAVFIVGQEGHGGDAHRAFLADHPEIGSAIAEMNELQNPTGRGFVAQALSVGGPMSQFSEPPEVAAWAEYESTHAPA
jgi:hypothetical protein